MSTGLGAAGGGETRELVHFVTQQTRFSILANILKYPDQLPSMYELEELNPSVSDATVYKHVQKLIDAGIVEEVALDDDQRRAIGGRPRVPRRAQPPCGRGEPAANLRAHRRETGEDGQVRERTAARPPVASRRSRTPNWKQFSAPDRRGRVGHAVRRTVPAADLPGQILVPEARPAASTGSFRREVVTGTPSAPVSVNRFGNSDGRPQASCSTNEFASSAVARRSR